MEELGGECTSHPLLLTVYRLTGVPNTGGSAIVYTLCGMMRDSSDGPVEPLPIVASPSVYLRYLPGSRVGAVYDAATVK